MLKKKKPVFLENSKIPKYLSLMAPINIKAITLFCFVLSTGTIDEKTRRHETIHFQQYLETLVVGFLLIYIFDFIVGYIKYKNGYMAYRMISLEQEAHMYDDVEDYLTTRTRYTWLKLRP